MGSIEGKEAGDRPQSSGSWDCDNVDEFDALWVCNDISREQSRANQSCRQIYNLQAEAC
jgi:hypothetical protein